MLQQFVFNEISPNAAGTAASSGPVQNANPSLAAGVAGPLDDCDGIDIVAILVGATGGTLDVYMQAGTPDGAWWDVVHFTQLSAGHGAVTYKTNISPVALGTAAAPTAIGSGLSPALATGTTVQGIGFDRMRLVFVAGASTSAGANIKVYATAQRGFAGPWQP
jgi:hypothetical protein